MSANRTRIVGVIVRQNDVLQSVVGHLYETPTGEIRSPMTVLASDLTCRGIGSASDFDWTAISQLARMEPGSLPRC